MGMQNNYSTHSSVTTMIESLNWNTLRERFKIARLSFFMILSTKLCSKYTTTLPKDNHADTLVTTIHFILFILVQTLRHIKTVFYH